MFFFLIAHFLIRGLHQDVNGPDEKNAAVVPNPSITD
jgi:hypothetical protein